MAHVDAGKTTLTDQILFRAGMSKTPGNVDKGSSQSDFLQIEKDRGISVQSGNLSFDWNAIRINLIDTPGHADFIAEVERSLWAIDAVVLLISAPEGVQAQTYVIWELLRSQNIPTILFVNKLDREGVDIELVTDEIKKELSPHIFPMQEVKSADINANPENIWRKESFSSANVEIIAENDDSIMEAYLSEEDIHFEDMDMKLRDWVSQAKIFPLHFGIAKTGLGVQALMNSIVRYLPPPRISDQVSGIIYRIRIHQTLGRLAYVRMFGGKLTKREEIFNQRLGRSEKISQLKSIFAQKLSDIPHIEAGDTGVVSGFQQAQAGDIIGRQKIEKVISSISPILTVSVHPQVKAEYFALAEALTIINIEEPSLDFEWLREEEEFHIKVNGWIQMQIIESNILERFGLKIEFGNPKIIYKETPKTIIYGIEEYTMPKPCWAVLTLKIEPMPPGYGYSFHSEVSVDKILLKYQKEIERTIPKALKQGIKGWEVTDVKITLIDGEDHNVHSRAGDFVVATPMALMNGLQEGGTDLLEPILHFKVIAPEEMLGKIASDLRQMRAMFANPLFENGIFRLEGKIPLASSIDYPVQLSSRSGGKAKIFTRFDSYRKVADDLGQIREYKGISPLDRAKYILQARKALR